jgi:hypothetical protein
MMQRV